MKASFLYENQKLFMQLTKFFLDLNLISEDTSNYVLIAIGLSSSFLYCFCCCFMINSTLVSSQDLAYSISEWWNNFKVVGDSSRLWTASFMFAHIEDFSQPSEIIQPAPVPQISFSGISILSSSSSSQDNSTSSWSTWQRVSEASRWAVLRSRTEWKMICNKILSESITWLLIISIDVRHAMETQNNSSSTLLVYLFSSASGFSKELRQRFTHFRENFFDHAVTISRGEGTRRHRLHNFKNVQVSSQFIDFN